MAREGSPKHQRRRDGRRGHKAQKAGPSRGGASSAMELPGTGPVRLQKVLAAAGIASRRGSETLIRDGRVTVNGRTAQLGDSADPSIDTVALDGERLRAEVPRYWILHKPTGVVTSVDDPYGRETVMHLLPRGVGRVHPVGRLDRDSSGLLLLTNDGHLTQTLLHPSHESEKEYRVTVKGQPDAATLERIRKGVVLEDGRTAPTTVSRVTPSSDGAQTMFHLVLIEGRKRQIRRMMLAVGNPVKRLVRVRVGPLTLGRLAPGAARPLRDHEVRALKAHAEKLRPSRRSKARAGRRRGAGRA